MGKSISKYGALIIILCCIRFLEATPTNLASLTLSCVHATVKPVDNHFSSHLFLFNNLHLVLSADVFIDDDDDGVRL